jgi:cytochrome P450
MPALLDATLGPLPAFLAQVTDDVSLVATPAGDQIWLVADYERARLILTDPRFSRSAAVKPGVPQFNDAQPAAQSVMSLDGAEHNRLRRVIASRFSPRRVAELTPFIENLADGYLDRVASAGAPVDLIESLATPLPLAVLCRLLGVPDEDTGQFKDKVSVLFDISAARQGTARSRIELARYMTALTDAKRLHPGDDLLSSMLGAQDRGELSRRELITMGLALLMAGFETTAGQISLLVTTLLARPELYQQLVAQPGLAPAVVEESLRLSPVAPLSFTRVAQEQVHLGDATVQPGEVVVVSLIHANRDAAAFPEPERLMLAERDLPHLTFGYGSHRCPGAQLAKAQLSVVLSRLVQRFPDLEISAEPDPVSWKQGLATRGLDRLMVEVSSG